jgi:hypothetical protein
MKPWWTELKLFGPSRHVSSRIDMSCTTSEYSDCACMSLASISLKVMGPGTSSMREGQAYCLKDRKKLTTRAIDSIVAVDIWVWVAPVPKGLAASSGLGVQPRGTKYSRPEFLGNIDECVWPTHNTRNLNRYHVAHNTPALAAGSFQARIQ